MNPHSLLQQTRRHFFSDCGIGLGKIALATLLSRQGLGAAQAPDFMQHPVKAKRVIFLFMAGAPSQLELFDHKPKLREIEGSPIPPSVIQGQPMPLFNLMLPCWDHAFLLPGTVNQEPNSRIDFLISAKWWTSWPSSNRCIPITSITHPPSFS
jgi:hypothetical protein